jgi:hypothetical protein
MKMETTESSETSDNNTQTPGTYPKESKLQLEFALLQLIQQIDKPVATVHYVLGKLPIKIIDPNTLYNILRNYICSYPRAMS